MQCTHSQTCSTTDISIEKPRKDAPSEMGSVETFSVPLETWTLNCVGGGGLGMGGGVSTVGSYAAATVVGAFGALLVLVDETT